MWKILRTKGIGVVVVEVQLQALAHGVEAMHEMDAIDCCNVSIVAVSPVTRDFDRFRGVFAELDDF